MPAPLTLLHTAASNQTLFAGLLHAAAPEVGATHLLEAGWLADCVAAGHVTPDVADGMAQAIRSAVADGAQLVVCTCSTLGAAFENAGQRLGAPVMRIDRPMAEAAVRSGARLRVVACVASTLAPTVDLISAVANAQGREVTIETTLLDHLWAGFLAGDIAGYHHAIATAVRALPSGDDAILLAQASMARAADLLKDHPIPVLASPRTGVEGVLRRLKAAA